MRAGPVISVLAAMLAAPAAAQAPALERLEPLAAGPSIGYFIADGMPGSAYRDGDDELARWALDEWSAATAGLIEFVPAEEGDALVRIYFVPADAGQYGEMRPIDVGGRRGAAVFVRPDTRGYGGPISAEAARDPLLRDTIVYLTCLHELGHALGLSHTDRFEDIMYFFGYGGDITEYFGRFRGGLETRADIEAASGLSRRDIDRLRQLYGIL